MADDKPEPAAGSGGPPDEPGPDGEPRRAPRSADGTGKEGKGDAGDKEKAGSKGEASGNADAGGKRERDQDKSGDRRERLGDNVYQRFHGTIYAPNATFGMGGGPAGGDEQARGRDEGPIEDTVIATIVRTYAKPACYDEAERALKDAHVVILMGAAGSGRRAGAIVMLAGVRAPDKQLVRINPSITLEKLSVRSFDAGTGYLISEKFAEPGKPGLTEFHWDALCQKVRKAKAYLVVTAGTGSITAVPDAIRQITWHRPDAADVLRAHIGASYVADDIIHKVAEALGTDYSLAGVGAIARRILSGEDIGQLLEELHGGTRQTVAGWLDDVDAAIPAVLEVAVLAFVLGITERLFEDELAELKTRLKDFAPELDTRSKRAKAEAEFKFRQLRKQRADHKLLTVRQAPVARSSGSIAVRHVDFRVPEYRRYVIAELWNSLGREFWTGMRRWLDSIADADDLDPLWHADLMNSMAIGLALLALVAPDEVIDCYLDPWTEEDSSAGQQTMAVYVVWQMSMLDQTAPLALRIAILWAGQGPPTQRMLAAIAFSGELGRRYPIEATKRLSQLADQKEPMVAVAFGQLFAALATQGRDAVVVLRELRRRMADKKDRQSADLLLEAVIELVKARDFRTGRPAAAVFLSDNAGLVADLGALWAQVLYLRPWRDRAIRALVATVTAIAKSGSGVRAKPQSPTEPGDLARVLGAAIGAEVPELARAPLRIEIARWVDQERRRRRRDPKPRDDDGSDPSLPPESDELLEKLLNAIVHPSPRELGK
ncbi:MAG TPA: hypothetical protein VFV73_44055 [Streptosporangiaceae bacterium]|nr:hypothetical protein [Streptosporangiaceae bacterium]